MSPTFGRVLSAMVTPFDENEELDLDAAQALASWLVESQGHEGLVLAGTTGESPTLTHDEQGELFRAVRRSRQRADHRRHRQQQHSCSHRPDQTCGRRLASTDCWLSRRITTGHHRPRSSTISPRLPPPATTSPRSSMTFRCVPAARSRPRTY